VANEIKRKLFHSLALVYLGIYLLLPKPMALGILGGLLLVCAAVEGIRLYNPLFNDWLLKKFGGIHRDEERHKPSGIVWTVLASFLVMLLFPQRSVVILAHLYLVFGDASAAIIGKRWGRHYFGKKSWEGSMACFVACILCGLPFFSMGMAIVGALVATVAEAIPWPLNDNLWMPLVSAAVLSILM